jgi:type IV secretory pathway TrbF-like protein
MVSWSVGDWMDGWDERLVQRVERAKRWRMVVYGRLVFVRLVNGFWRRFRGLRLVWLRIVEFVCEDNLFGWVSRLYTSIGNLGSVM